MNPKYFLLSMSLLAGLCLHGQAAVTSVSDALQAAQALRPSLVRVAYQLQFDKGEPPRGAGMMERCPNCGRLHINRADELMENERPLELPGYLVSESQVVTVDPQIHPRFIKSISVRQGSVSAPAEWHGYAQKQNAIFLKIAQPLPGAKALSFKPEADGPFFLLAYQPANGDWSLNCSAVPNSLVARELDAPFTPLATPGLLIDGQGIPVGLTLEAELPLDQTWKTEPSQWTTVAAADMAQALSAIEKAAEIRLPRVALGFRSPKATGSMGMRRGYMSDDAEGDEAGTEKNVIGVVLSPKQILVLASLKSKVTTRLERITVYPGDGQPITAKFAASLKDYGAFVATLDQPLARPLEVTRANILEQRRQRLAVAEIVMQGEKRVAYISSGRIASFEFGPKQRAYPIHYEGLHGTFLFASDGALVALSVAPREKPSTERNYSSDQWILTPARYLAEALADLPKHSDPANVPLSEQEENRVVWLGVELQPLNKELARANGISDQTQDGKSGALVTFVYPDSPAARAGIEPGSVLLRLRTAGQAAPIQVKIEDDRMSRENFPWSRLSELPEQYFDQLPSPWAPVENSFTRLLTDFGVGAKFTAEFFINGKLVAKEFEAVASPPHYESAERFKADALGLTVRNLTYEVRQYLQKKPEEPGVVVGKIEAGSKASISGIKPYELITHVNDQPVMNAQDFKKLIATSDELKLSVKRMAQGRIVTIRVSGSGNSPSTSGNSAKPASVPAE